MFKSLKRKYKIRMSAIRYALERSLGAFSSKRIIFYFLFEFNTEGVTNSLCVFNILNDKRRCPGSLRRYKILNLLIFFIKISSKQKFLEKNRNSIKVWHRGQRTF